MTVPSLEKRVPHNCRGGGCFDQTGGVSTLLPYQRKLKTRSQQMRKEGTPQENKLWYGFLRRHSIRFTRQKPLGNYIVDFLCPSRKLVIEIDGSQHFEESGLEYDKIRTAYLNGLGLHVLRFTNKEVNDSFYHVCTEIQNYLDSHQK
jgi:very-short-patch-repair endonuclease